jgi:methylated-DNA-[protein]-cysteine S-methyltransferase
MLLRGEAMAKNPVKGLAEVQLASPLGRVRIAATDRGVREIEVAPRTARAAKRFGSSRARTIAARAARQLREYFAGRRTAFDLPLDLQGSEKQKRVWHGLLEIPFGQTLTYGELARRLGVPRAARAVGAACGANPVWLVVPCHRVIGSDGGLHGYGGGLAMKQALLEWEGAAAARERSRQRALPFPEM